MARWTITAIADDGEHASIKEDDDGHLRQLLAKAVHVLYGADKNVEDYELVIAGVTQTNLDLTLEQAGLHDGSEVIVQPKDVSKG